MEVNSLMTGFRFWFQFITCFVRDVKCSMPYTNQLEKMTTKKYKYQIDGVRVRACFYALVLNARAQAHRNKQIKRKTLTIGMDASDVISIPKIAQFCIKRSNYNHILSITSFLSTHLIHTQKKRTACKQKRHQDYQVLILECKRK